jgi:hypothetical protein
MFAARRARRRASAGETVAASNDISSRISTFERRKPIVAFLEIFTLHQTSTGAKAYDQLASA